MIHKFILYRPPTTTPPPIRTATSLISDVWSRIWSPNWEPPSNRSTLERRRTLPTNSVQSVEAARTMQEMHCRDRSGPPSTTEDRLEPLYCTFINRPCIGVCRLFGRVREDPMSIPPSASFFSFFWTWHVFIFNLKLFLTQKNEKKYKKSKIYSLNSWWSCSRFFPLTTSHCEDTRVKIFYISVSVRVGIVDKKFESKVFHIFRDDLYGVRIFPESSQKILWMFTFNFILPVLFVSM